MNVLFITLDQFRGDSYGAAGHPLVQTPTLDRIAREGVRLARHYSQAAPCSPGRAAIYTGTYQMNNRVVANGTPLPKGLDNIAHVARRGGYDPTLFGYTDQGVDPANAEGNDDPRLDSYDGVLPGLSVGLYLPESQAGWIQHLREKGYDVPYGWEAAARGEPSAHGMRPGKPILCRPSSVRGGGGVLATVRPRGRRDADCAGSRVAATRDPRRGDGI